MHKPHKEVFDPNVTSGCGRPTAASAFVPRASTPSGSTSRRPPYSVRRYYIRVNYFFNPRYKKYTQTASYVPVDLQDQLSLFADAPFTVIAKFTLSPDAEYVPFLQFP